MDLLVHETPVPDLFFSNEAKEHLTVIVKEVLKHRTQLEVGAFLNHILDSSRRRIPGFKTNSLAPVNKLANLTIELAEADSTGGFIGYLLDGWIELRSDLAEAVREVFGPFIPGDLPAFGERATFNYVCEHDDFERLIKSQASSLLTLYEEADVELMTILLLDIVPASTQSFVELKAEHEESLTTLRARSMSTDDPSGWSGFLEPWLALPAESPLWDDLTPFLEQLAQLADQKRAQRSNFMGELKEKLEAVQNSSAITHFEAVTVNNWSADHLTEDEAQVLISDVDRFDSLLSEYAELDAMKQKNSRIYQRLGTLIEEIETLARQLSLKLEAGTPDHDPEPPGQANISASTEDLNETPASEDPIEDLQTEDHSDAYARDLLEVHTEDIETPSAEDAASGIRETADDASADFIAESTPETHEPELVAEEVLTVSETLETAETVSPRAEADDEQDSPSVETLWAVEAAQAALNDSSNLEPFFWSMLAVGDFSGAYWMAHELEHRNAAAPLPSALLKLIYGAHIVAHEDDQIVGDLAQTISEYSPDSSTDIEQLLAIGSSLHAVLVAPSSGLNTWLNAAENGTPVIRSLGALVAQVREFARLGEAVHPEYFNGSSPDERRSAIALQAQEMEQALADAPLQRNKFQRATNVWRSLVSRSGDLYRDLEPIANNRAGEYSRVTDNLGKWLDESSLKTIISKEDQHTNGHTTRPITGNALQQLMRDIRALCDIGLTWCRMVDSDQRANTNDDWLLKRVDALRDGCKRVLPGIHEDIVAVLNHESGFERRAAIHALGHQINKLQSTLALKPNDFWWNQQPMRAFESHLQHRGQTLTPRSTSLRYALGRRLIWLPEVDLSEADLQPTAESLSNGHLVDGLLRSWSTGRTAGDALQLWIEQADFRFVDWLASSEETETDVHSIEALRGARLKLSNDKERVQGDIEGAFIDGIISEEERSRLSTTVETIDPENTLLFKEPKLKLDGISDKLSSSRQQRLKQLTKLWEQVKKDYRLSFQEENWTRIENILTDAFESADTRAIDEALAQTKNISQTDETNLMDFFDSAYGTGQETPLLDFVKREESLLKALDGGRGVPALSKTLQREGDFAGFSLASIGSIKKKDIEDCLDAWRKLKDSGQPRPGDDRGDLHNQVRTILTFIGFEILKTPSSFTQDRNLSDAAAMQIKMSASETLVRPIPQLGTLTHNRYDVICVWDRPHSDSLAALLFDQRIESRNGLLVIYMGRLTPSKRLTTMKTLRERGLPVFILDEVLLAFLALKSVRQSPLPVFVRCALPFSAVNPYTPFRAGDVPPEMFYGRETMSIELQRDSGTSLVYGGRQLGKSALLRHVQRRFHNPERGQYAWVEDIKQLGDAAAGQDHEELWYRLRDSFKQHELISPKISTDRPEDILKYLREALQKRPEIRVLVLLDEADNFLEADAESGFKVVDRLRQLMAETGRRFKVVFAGLHNVQRFNSIPNQPLAHFGEAICVGPLEPNEALKLVQEPLGVLGFSIEREIALRILSYTNYHPGLIQLFCYELLKMLLSRPIRKPDFPISVERPDVAAVYQKAEVRGGIRDRFNWTLALDKRYQAIVWSLIDDQIANRDSFAKQYSVSEIKRMVTGLWEAGFKGVELKPLLDEMKGLGVLVEEEGVYQLRSPNLVRLIGEENVEDHLLELDGQSLPASRLNQDHHHQLLDKKKHLYSPLTYAQERSLNTERSGVGLIFASSLSGIETITDLVPRRFLPSGLEDREKAYKSILPVIRTSLALSKEIDNFVKGHPKAKRLIVVYQPPADIATAELANMIGAAHRLCKGASKTRLQVYFVCSPEVTWMWAGIPVEKRQELDRQIATNVTAGAWSDTGLRQVLEREDFATDKRAAITRVSDATGGWASQIGLLLEHFYSEPREALIDGIARARELATLADRLQKNQDPYVILRECGLESLPSASALLRFVVRHQDEKGLEVEYLPEAITDENECNRALLTLERLGYLSTLKGDADCVLVDNALLKRIFA